MMDVNKQVSVPLDIPRSRRNHPVSLLTSFQPGVCAPLAFIPLLREDDMSARFTVSLEMMETHEFLVNPVMARISAYLVPWLAMERFQGSRDQFDRSYMGQAQVDGGSVVPFFSTVAAGTHGANPILKTTGLHAPSAQQINTMYVEAYNLIWNYRAKNRSKSLTARLLNATSLAPAFWEHSRFANILPSFDQAIVDGEVPLTIAGNLALTGTALVVRSSTNASGKLRKSTDGSLYAPASKEGLSVDTSGSIEPTPNTFELLYDPNGTLKADLAGVVAELNGTGVRISLANIELAKKTQAFAKMRERYVGHSDDWIIDMLMNGLTIPDQAMKNPILLSQTEVRINQAKRYATDAANLAVSAVSGGAEASISVRVPRINTGGVVVVMIEAVPDQLFERQADPFLYTDNVADLPEFLPNYLDVQKVDSVFNGDIDTQHSSPTGLFGYEPLNAKWTRNGPRVGGKFYKPASGSANDAERRRLWGIEQANPSLSADFYIVNTAAMHLKPFVNTTADPFECWISGAAAIGGNTVFGPSLIEDNNSYDDVLADAPTTQIA